MSARLPRQQIRPSLAELRTLPPEYDFEDDEDGDEEEDGPTFAPSASSSRAAPPVIETSRADGRSKPTKQPGGRVAENDLHSTSRKHQRFDVRFSDETGQDDNVNAGEDDAPEEEAVAPLIGTIQERRPYGKAFETKRSDRAGQSRFAARRALDHDAGLIKPKEQAGPSQKPERPQAPAPDMEEWLDEDGQPMSAFRKNRLIKQGLRPPSVRPLTAAKTATTGAHASTHPPSEQSGSMAALMQSISHENESKIAAMSAQDVEEELRELQDGLGSNLLELLRSRKAKSATPKDAIAKGVEDDTKLMTQRNADQAQDKGVLTSEDIRQKYFPNEPKTIPSALEWTYDIASTDKGKETSSTSLRFDFDGRRIDDVTASDLSQTHLAGLHHHGQDQHRPGYTTEELIHLARSTNPSQRVMSLQSLARIVSRYTEKPPKEEEEQGKTATENADSKTSDHLIRSNIRGQACIISSWYVETKQANVRSAALACIRACLSSTFSAGLQDSTPFVELPRLGSSNQSTGNSGEENGHDSSDGDEKAKLPGIHAESLRLVLIPGIIGSMQLREASTFELSTALDILLILLQCSRNGCNVAMEYKDVLRQSFSRHVLEHPWPSRTAASPVAMRFLQLLNTLIVSSRRTAITLVEQNWVDPLLRFISIPPWSIDDTAEQVNVWQHMRYVLQIYISLGQYGIASDTYGRSHSLFNEVQQWVLRLDDEAMKDEQVQPVAVATLENVMRLLTVWTVCATDAHQTHNHHDITWSQVSEWWECAIAAITWIDRSIEMDREGDAHEGHVQWICAQMEAIRLLSGWIEGAHINRRDDTDALSSHIGHVVRIASTSLQRIKGSVQLHIDQLTVSMHKGDILSGKGHVDAIVRLCRAASAPIRFSRLDMAKDQSDSLVTQIEAVADVLLKRLSWTLPRSVEMEQRGIAGQQRAIAEFVYDTLRLLQDRSGSTKADDWLRLALLFPEGNEVEAKDVLLKRLGESLPNEKEKIHTLSPFVTELLRYEASSVRAPLDATTVSIKTSDTLFRICQQGDKKLDTDPLSGAPLWKSANSGLPLRSDWPTVALDDLLHSGNCAALNRPDVLEQSWDANEIEIVVAALDLGVALWKQTSEDEQRTLPTTEVSALPSAEEVIMAIMKVYMLEEEQASVVHSRATGKITGRDIYRDSRVSVLLSSLFDVANAISAAASRGTGEEAAQDRRDSLERVAVRQFGTALSFYQFYTSLVGLYDAISYGDELFGRAVLAATQMRYSADYRRLIWSDYAHCLATLTTSVEYAPGGFSSYVDEVEQDDTVIRGMTMALLGGYVRKERNTLLYRVAIYHLGALLWSTGLAGSSIDKGAQQRAERLAKTLFGGDLALDSGDGSLQYLELVRSDLLSWTDAASSDAAGEAECHRRKQWVGQACHR